MWSNNVANFVLVVTLCSCRSDAKILRNNALMNKMVSNFHSRDNNISPERVEKDEYQPDEPRDQITEQLEPSEQDEQIQTKNQRIFDLDPPPQQTRQNKDKSSVVVLMQKVLCKNFPTIPCDVIIRDDTLKRLIQKSVSQIKHKRFDKNINQLLRTQTPPPTGHLTFFPVVNSEDLSNFLLVRDPTNLYSTKTSENPAPRKHKKKHKKGGEDSKPHKSRKKQILNSKDTGSVIEGSRKKIRKFYPHKLKGLHAEKHNLPTYSEERTSMSVEVPDAGIIRKRHLPVHTEEDYPSVWRIDYLKHGDPTIARINHENDYFQGKITKTGDNVIVDENVLEPASRRDVLHPDIYIKKNYGKKSPSTTIL